jgi:hypothetical protein
MPIWHNFRTQVMTKSQRRNALKQRIRISSQKFYEDGIRKEERVKARAQQRVEEEDARIRAGKK